MFSTKFQLPVLAILVLCAVVSLPEVARAGGGPENVLLVVNRRSYNSLTIANYYIRLRQIPPGNVLTLSWHPDKAETTIERFREEILTPVLETIKKRRLTGQIDYVVYSSDFPWAIDLKSDMKKFRNALSEARASKEEGVWERDPPWLKLLKEVASPNALTYLHQAVMAGEPVRLRMASAPGYMELQSNLYTRAPGFPASKEIEPTLGFRAGLQFGSGGRPVAEGGRSYLLSTMLGVTAGRGNTLKEVLVYLQRSSQADGTHPGGTIYYMRNNDVRSKSRHDSFPAAVEQLKKLGVAAKIGHGIVPSGQRDVQGAMIGTKTFSWPTSQSTILPGAICENFTSYGGIMRSTAGQTPLSEFLRYGAAGSCGTVVEPFALPLKFPRASIHVHYARGCTLAEAFYQSITCPYQQLIVGDPLCRPWANIPQVTVEGAEPGSSIQGKMTLKPSATIGGDSKIERFELFIDGWRRAECKPGEPLPFDTAALADGYHELRVVAVETGPIASQGRKIFSVSTDNHGRKITASAKPNGTVSITAPVVVTVDSPGSTAIVVLHNSRMIGQIKSASGKIEINPAILGYGPVGLRVVAIGQGGPNDYVTAKPIELTVTQ